MRKELSKLALTANLVLAMALTLSLAACGGGGSDLPANKYFGKLPQIDDSWRIENKAAKDKYEKDDSKNAWDKYEKNKKELREKYEADSKAETASLAGKEIPVSYTDEFKASEAGQTYEIGKVKIKNKDGYCVLEIPVTAKKDFTMPNAMNSSKWNAMTLNMLYMTEDGRKAVGWLLTPEFKTGPVTAGTSVTGERNCCGDRKGCAYFSGIKLHTMDEKQPEDWKEAEDKK